MNINIQKQEWIINTIFAVCFLFIVFYLLNYATSLKELDKSEIGNPIKLNVYTFNNKITINEVNFQQLKDPEKSIKEKERINEFLKEVKKAGLRKRGIFYSKVTLSYPQYLIIPEYSKEVSDNVWYYVIDENGNVKVQINDEKFEGKVSEEVTEKINGIFNN